MQQTAILTAPVTVATKNPKFIVAAAKADSLKKIGLFVAILACVILAVTI